MTLLKNLVVFVLMVSFIEVSLAETYLVGDSNGWTSMGEIDYEEWTSHKSFHVGDTIEFDYNNQYHNVKQVIHEDFQQCIPTSPIDTYSTGSDKIVLTKPGHYYFLCGYPGHCQVGQKIDIFVKPSSFPRTTAPPSIPSASPPLTSNILAPASSSISNTATIFHSSKLVMALKFFLLVV